MRKTTSTNYINEENINATCGTAYTLSLIGGRWKPVILWSLHIFGRIRYSQLRKNIPNISERILVSHLKELEQDQLITRIVYPEVPPRVEYELTELGQSMKTMLQHITDWGEKHRESVGSK